MDQRFYTVDEVADILRVHRNTVYRWCRSGRLPATKLGKDWRIAAAGIAELEGGAPSDGSSARFDGAAGGSAAGGIAAAGIDAGGGGAAGGDVVETLGRLEIGDHVLGLVPDDDEVFELEWRFLKAGLEREERAFKGCWWQSAAEYRNRLAQAGIDVEYYERTGRLEIVELAPIYVRSGPGEAGRAWGEAATRAAALGYRGLWGSGSPSLDCCGDSEGLLGFEYGMDRALKGRNAVALCIYSLDTCRPDRFSDLLAVLGAHSRLLMTAGEEAVLAAPVFSESVLRR